MHAILVPQADRRLEYVEELRDGRGYRGAWAMIVLLTIFLHCMLVGSLILFVAYGLIVTFQTSSLVERLIRLGAWFSGAMVVIGAQAGGLSFADFTVNALSGTRPAAEVATLFGALVPGALGVALASYLTNSVRRSSNVAIRVMAFVGMLAATQFAQIYAVALNARGMNIGAAAIPNLSFVVGIVMYIVLTWDPESRNVRRSSLRAALRLSWGRHAPAEADAEPQKRARESMFRQS